MSPFYVTGSVFGYRAFKPDFESHHSPEYCEKILCEAAFWCTNLPWVAVVLFRTAALCQQLCRCICERKTKDNIEAGGSSAPTEEEEEEENSPLSDEIEHLPQTTSQNSQPKTTELKPEMATVESETTT